MRRTAPLLALACLAAAAAGAETGPAPADVPADPLAVQVLLDRAGFSTGAADGTWGANSVKALAAFQEAHGLAASGRLDAETRENLIAAAGSAESLATYVVDAEGATWQLLAEQFHTTPELLERLNPGAELAPGARLQVPNVRSVGGGEAGKGSASVRVVVAQGDGTLTVENGSDVLFFAPVAAGSRRESLPLGEWRVEGVQDGQVWISPIGSTASHGRLHLTTWDALRVAALVRPGTRVLLRP